MSVSAVFRDRLATPIAALVCLVTAALIQDSIRGIGAGATALVVPPPAYIGLSIDPRIIRRLLGIRIVVADLVWIDTMIKSDLTHERKAFTPIYRAFRSIVALDPDNLLAYYVAGMYLSVVKDDIKGATAIMRDGVQYMETHSYTWPHAWKIPFTLGYNLIFEENDTEEGSKWIRRAAEMQNAPQMVRTLATHVSTELGRGEIAARVLNDMYRRATRPEEKKLIEAKMLAVAVRHDLIELNEKFKIFLAATNAYSFSRKKQFQVYMRSIGHSGKDINGNRLGIGDGGKIIAMPTGPK